MWQRYLAQEKVEEDSLYAALYNLAGFQIFETDPEKMTSLYDLVDGVTVIELAGYSSEIQNTVVALTTDLFYAQMQKRGKPVIQGDYRQLTKMILVDEADNFMRQDFASLRKIIRKVVNMVLGRSCQRRKLPTSKLERIITLHIF